MHQPIAITGFYSISAASQNPVLESKHNLLFDKQLQAWVGRLPHGLQVEIQKIRDENRNYQGLDDSVLYAMFTSREAVKHAQWQSGSGYGINIGSSRGATQLFEHYYSAFAKDKHTETLASPTTTLGNISSWVAQDLQNDGPEISHSITCSTALHALLNGVAWLRSGMCERFLVGGSEAALTPFTIAQMRAMKTYSRANENTGYPCRALDPDKKENTMVLGEGAASACLELGACKNALAYVTGVGYATETLTHAVSVTKEADCFQKSMKMALGGKSPALIDAIVMHAPGTMLGDASEAGAILKVFGESLPLLTTNKWKLGHTFGASGLLNLELAIAILQKQKILEIPYVSPQTQRLNKIGTGKEIKNILVNAVGFGGNAVSILVSKP
ncbi:MAG: beta-ketoacyl synthase [Cytophagaceae bacterium]|nr:beta-ketoacyl synthase [Cytophagaceae bacterium]